MNRDEFFRRIDQVKVGKSGGQRAPHKPLLLLLGLGRVLNGKGRLASYVEIAEKLTTLLQSFGPPTKPRPEYPFSRLSKDGLWDIPESHLLTVTSSGDFSVRDLKNRSVEGGFPKSLHLSLCNAPELVQEAAHRVLDRYFPKTQHDDIREAVGLSSDR